MHQPAVHVSWSRPRLIAFLAVFTTAVALVTAASGVLRPARAAADEGGDASLPVIALHGYSVSLFARGTMAYTHPDSIVVSGDRVWIDYQNVTSKTGDDGKSSTIVEYNREGKALRTVSILGHSDGLRLNPYTHVLWAMVNEDGNPALYSIDPHTLAVAKYSLATPHGGGYDDIAFLNGKAFVTASNPKLDANGVNIFPALVTVVLKPDHTTTLGTVLAGNASAFDTVNQVKVTLNEVDPDSLSIDSHGQLVMVNQSGAEVVTIKNPGAANQVVTTMPVGSQLDDTVWATSHEGRLFVVDGSQNATYIVRTAFVPGTVYTQTPDDSGVTGLLGTIDQITGRIHPVAIGLGKPTGMVFVPGDAGGDDRVETP
jgi:hypothetical protein